MNEWILCQCTCPILLGIWLIDYFDLVYFLLELPSWAVKKCDLVL